MRARLTNLSRQRGETFQYVLTRYANERLLYRLSVSQHSSRFILKGAALFTVWSGSPHRPTRDLDLLGQGDPSEEHLREVFVEVLAAAVENDGVHFDPSSLEVGPIREDDEYGGVRVRLKAEISGARIPLQVDVGFGDAVTPEASWVEFPALLNFSAPRLLAYPRETAVAEKLHAMVHRGQANSRMKDFYDLALLSNKFEFEGGLLSRAIQATFERRGTPLPVALPLALTAEFFEAETKKTQWVAFVRKSGLQDADDLAGTVATIKRFLEKPLTGAHFSGHWPAGGAWAVFTPELAG